MKILVTGFKPFLGDKINPSEKLAIELAREYDHVEAIVLPVEFGNSFEILKTKILKLKPDYVVMIGQASGRKNICLEKVGLNWVQTENKDEAGIAPKAGKILSAVELALMSLFPVDQTFLELKRVGFPVEISFSAGAYVCNDLYFRVLNEFKELKAVFVHVPLLPEQLKADDLRPALSFEMQLEVLKQMIMVQKFI